MNRLKCFICNQNLTKIKTMYLFDFYFNQKCHYIYLCDKHHHLCHHKSYQHLYTNISTVKNQIHSNYESSVNKNPITIIYEKHKYQYPRYY